MAAKGPTRKMRRRIFMIVVPVVALVFVVLLARVFVISVVDGDYYQKEASSQQLSDITVNPKRGTIYDRNMTILAQSAQVWTVIISPLDIEEDDREDRKSVV